jgi:hypothetical protein
MMDIVYDGLFDIFLIELELSSGDLPTFSPTPLFDSTEPLTFKSFNSSYSKEAINTNK